MKITKRQLRRIIRKTLLSEGLQDVGQPMTPEYVEKSMMGKGAVSGRVFMDTALEAIELGDFRTAASAVMDGLWIDDPPPGASEELEGLLEPVGASVGYGRGADPNHLAQIAAEWGTRHFR